MRLPIERIATWLRLGSSMAPIAICARESMSSPRQTDPGTVGDLQAAKKSSMGGRPSPALTN